MEQRVFVLGLVLFVASASAQVREAWTQRYNAGSPACDHRPVAMILDQAGNAYVAGSSQNTNSDYDYVLLKYSPAGSQLWAARYDSASGANDQVKSFALSRDGSACLTGTGGTVKFASNEALAWSAPYAGNGIATDTNGNVYITGFSTDDYATVKLAPSGTNIWLRTYDKLGMGQPDVSQLVAVDDQQNVYVAGWETWTAWANTYYKQPALLKYDFSGTLQWVCEYNQGPENPADMRGLALDGSGNIYVTDNEDTLAGAITAKVSSNGLRAWTSYSGPWIAAMAVRADGAVVLVGSRDVGAGATSYITYMLGNDGSAIWTKQYPGGKFGRHAAKAVSIAHAGYVVVTGVSTNTATRNDWATIKYDKDGNQIWVMRYNGPANGDDGAVAIAVGGDGAVYVTGYSANASGGTDITTIKYIQPVPIQREPDGSMRLQSPGTPGGTNGIQASTNLQSWLDLGLVPADTNGIFTFEDTNAPAFERRFYRWYQP